MKITKCRLAELKVPEGRWSPEAVLLVKKAVLGAEDSKILVTFYDVSTVRASLHHCITSQTHRHDNRCIFLLCSFFAHYPLSPFKILELEQQKENFLVHVYLFIGAESLELDKSVNRQLAQSDSWSKTITQKNAFDCTSPSEDAGSFCPETPNYCHKIRLPVCSPLPSLKPSCDSSK